MKGLELCEAYYNTYGSKMIRDKFARYQDRIAIGLIGEGSDCFGYDDEISRDHDWGPGFCLWLDSDDYNAVGSALQAEYEKLPQYFENFKRLSSRWGKTRIGVFEIGAFYRRFIGRSSAPDNAEQWFSLPEPNLAVCTNGKIFCDPLGKFSAIREGLLAYFPEDVRLAKIVSHCIAAAQSGQYNYPRMMKRDEPFAAQYALTKFCAEVISLAFLLNRRFCPFYKWSHKAVRELTVLGDYLYRQVHSLITEPDVEKQEELIENISSAMINAFKWQHLSTCESTFLLDHGSAIIRKISDPRMLEIARSLV